MVLKVVAAIDAENAGSEAGGGGGGGGDGPDVGNAAKGAALARRDGKQMDLLLEVESLEPKQLMSVCMYVCIHTCMYHINRDVIGSLPAHVFRCISILPV